jgi:type I restriction enzyme, S subunit
MTSDVTSRFEQTDAGLIPTDWDVKTIGQALQFYSGKAHEPYVSRFGKFVVVNSKFISTDGKIRKYCTKNVMPARSGDVLMVMSDLPNGRALAKCFLVDRDDLYAVNQRVCIFRSRIHDPRYLRYILNRNPYFMAFDDGVQQTHLLNGPIKRCPVVLPSVGEQRAIAESLSVADELIGALEGLIAKKQAIKQGMMQQLLTPEPTWRHAKLASVADVIDPHPSHRAPTEVSHGVPFLGIGDLGANGRIISSSPRRVASSILSEHAARYDFSDGLLGLGRVASIGKVIRFPRTRASVAISPTMGLIRPRRVPVDFLFYALQSPFVTGQLMALMAGSTRSSIGMESLRRLVLQPHLLFASLIVCASGAGLVAAPPA